MPELPEVETVRRGLNSTIKGTVIRHAILRRWDLRIPFPKNFATDVQGRKIINITRRAKYLLFDLGGGEVLIAHLGMTGRFFVAPKKPKSYTAHDHVIFELKDGRALIYNDARRFGLMTLAKKVALANHPLFAHLAPEPFDKSFSPVYLKSVLVGKNTPIKTALMDSSLVVGVGNIYASEALFLARIHPRTPANKAAKHAASLVKSIRQVLKEAIASGGSSLRDFLHLSGEAGLFQHRFQVYGRKGKPCFACGIPIRSIRIAGRSTFFCHHCQT